MRSRHGRFLLALPRQAALVREPGAVLRLALIGASVLTLAAGGPALFAQTKGSPERFTALAVNMSNIGVGGASTVEIVVNRWSTDAERDQLMNTLFEQGPQKLLSTLQKLPRVGYFRTPNSIGYDLHYARRTPNPDGGERVTLLTDRRVGFWEAANQPRTVDYPFTMIEMHINADGEGEGKLSLFTKITGDAENKLIVLEDYANQPIQLNAVKRERKK